jgi:hypothetical protein
MVGLRVEAQRAPAFIHQLPRGGHSERRSSGAGSWQQPANDFPALPRTGAAGRDEGVVCDCAGGQELNPPAAGTKRKSEG